VHGTHEWLEMFLLIRPLTDGSVLSAWIGPGRVVLLAVSFLFLIQFGARLVVGPLRARLAWQLLGVISAIWVAGLAWLFLAEPPAAHIVAADVYTRYSLAIPGAALAAWGLFLQREKFMQAGMRSFGRDMIVAALAFGLYGCIGQLFAAPSVVFPSEFLNSDTFLDWFGFRIQLFRSLMACIAAVVVIHSALMAGIAQQLGLSVANALLQEQAQEREQLLGELLHQVVGAQEAERRRIARELHDATGQSLTAISLGLRGVETRAFNEASPVVAQVHELGAMSTQALGELRQIIADLRPSHLDDLGLAPTLRWYLKQYEARWRIQTRLVVGDEQTRLPAEYETVLFRITQEALNNVAKHAQAQNVTVTLALKSPEATLTVEDDGCGFDPAAVQPRDSRQGGWGLLGIRERATLVGGRVEILSRPGQGTRLVVTLPMPLESQHAGQEDQIAAGG